MLKAKPVMQLENRIALVTDLRTAYDVANKRPFCGPMGDMVLNELRKNDIVVSSCYLACVNDTGFDKPSLSDPGILGNLIELRADLSDFQPNIVLLVGRTCLRLAGIDTTLDRYRGSVFICRDAGSPFYNFKCMAVYTPKETVANSEKQALTAFDFKKLKRQSLTPDIKLPTLDLQNDLPANEVVDRLMAIKDGDEISVDIEGGIPNPEDKKYPNEQGVKCIGIATSPTSAFIVNPWDFSEANTRNILRAFGQVADNPNIHKILQNSLYDNFVLSWLWNCMLKSVTWDTLISGWEIYPELPKALETQVSIYTNWPYYKDEKHIKDKLTHYLYCLKDAAYTFQLKEIHQRIMKPAALAHFNLNMELLPAILYSELRGFAYRPNDAFEYLSKVDHEIDVTESRIQALAGKPVNMRSPKQVADLFYKQYRYETQYNKDYKTGEQKVTTDVNALLKLMQKYDKPVVVAHALRHRTLESLGEQLGITTDLDLRVRCSYTIVGTDTGRLSCSGSPTKSGANLQTIQKKVRRLYRADDGYDLGEVDLSGADGWTVAIQCHIAGDSTMLEDYRFGLKPAIIIGLMYEEFIAATKGLSQKAAASFRSSINGLSRPQIADLCRAFNKKGWLYDACKAVQHGTNYAMKPPTMSENLLKQSHKKSGIPVFVPVRDCDILQKLYLARYPGIALSQQRIDYQLLTEGKLTAASGHVRRFFGRPKDAVTQRAAYAHIPQHNTTYATKLALHRLWTDKDNWHPNGLPIIEPLHQVHDAIVAQWPSDRRTWALAKLNSYFQNEIVIDGVPITIPFEGHWGTDWGTMPNDI